MIQPKVRFTGTLAALLLAAGCASSGSGASSAAESATSTANAAERLSTALGDLGAKLTTMDDAITGVRESVGTEGLLSRQKVAKGDIQAEFAAYQSALKGVRATHEQVVSMNAVLGREMESYLATWDQNLTQMQNEQLVSLSTRRRDEARRRFDEARKTYQDVGERCAAQVKQLGEIELVLGSDLTPAGIGALDKTLAKARDTNEDLEKDLAKASTVMGEFSSALRAGKPEPAG